MFGFRLTPTFNPLSLTSICSYSLTVGVTGNTSEASQDEEDEVVRGGERWEKQKGKVRGKHISFPVGTPWRDTHVWKHCILIHNQPLLFRLNNSIWFLEEKKNAFLAASIFVNNVLMPNPGFSLQS